MTNVDAAENRWTVTTKALLLGFVALTVLLHQAFVQGVGFVPSGASQLMMWVAVVGIVGYALLRQGVTAGYWLSVLTGLLYLVFIGVLMSGLLGPLPSDGPLIGLLLGPIAQGAYAIVLVVATYVALRERDGSEPRRTGEDATARAQ